MGVKKGAMNPPRLPPVLTMAAVVPPCTPPIWTAAVEIGGVQGGTTAAIVNTGGNLGGFIAPFLTPIVSHAVRNYFGLSDQAGWQWGISLAGIFCLSGAALWGLIRPAEYPCSQDYLSPRSKNSYAILR